MVLTEKIEKILLILEDKNRRISRLEQELEFSKAELKRISAENVELQRKYDNLTIAKSTISLSNGDISQAKKRITDLMAQIDVCIDKLSN